MKGITFAVTTLRFGVPYTLGTASTISRDVTEHILAGVDDEDLRIDVLRQPSRKHLAGRTAANNDKTAWAPRALSR
ncbi:hypothetical protein VTG60DRAFT_97 [Thermothelomyces hinnuleus]